MDCRRPTGADPNGWGAGIDYTPGDDMIRQIIGVVIIMVALIGMASAGLTSVMVVDASGLVSANTNTGIESPQSIASYSTSTFGVASMNYASMSSEMGISRDILTSSGKLFAYDSMSMHDWKNPVTNCCDGKCEETPGFSTMTMASSNIMMNGPGSISTSSGVNSFYLSTAGMGMLDYRTGVSDIQGITSAMNKTSTFTSSERVSIVGIYNMTSMYNITHIFIGGN